MPNVKTGAKSPTLPDALRLKITYFKVEDLKPYAGNARTHSDKQIDQIAASIRQFSFVNPVLIDDAGGIVAGHGRVAAARKLGYDKVPGCCQTNSNQSQFAPECVNLCGTKLAPLGKCGGSVELEVVA